MNRLRRVVDLVAALVAAVWGTVVLIQAGLPVHNYTKATFAVACFIYAEILLANLTTKENTTA